MDCAVEDRKVQLSTSSDQGVFINNSTFTYNNGHSHSCHFPTMATQYRHQVGGHAATILSSPLSSSTLIKPSSPVEKAFYTQLGPSLFPNGEFMGVWTPAFYGTLNLHGKMEGDVEGNETRNNSGGSPVTLDILPENMNPLEEMLVLENLTHRFRRPNVIDLKLGTQLYDETTATVEKIERMKKAARETTSADTGVRLTGFQTWNSDTSEYVMVDKQYGKNLKPSQLLEGITRFFAPLLVFHPESAILNNLSTLSSSASGELNARASSSQAASTQVSIAEQTKTLSRLLPHLIAHVNELRSLLASAEFRMRGGSLLIIVEGDASVLKNSLDRYEQRTRQRTNPKLTVGAGGRSFKEEEEDIDDTDSDASTSSLSSTDSQGNAASHTWQPFDFRLVDFAHTRLAYEGEGCDEGLLKGLSTTRDLLDKYYKSLQSS